MTATVLLAAGSTKTISDEFEVAAGASVALGMFSSGVWVFKWLGLIQLKYSISRSTLYDLDYMLGHQ